MHVSTADDDSGLCLKSNAVDLKKQQMKRKWRGNGERGEKRKT